MTNELEDSTKNFNKALKAIVKDMLRANYSFAEMKTFLHLLVKEEVEEQTKIQLAQMVNNGTINNT